MAGVRVERWEGPPPTADELRARFAEESLSPHAWSNGPGDRYSEHAHGYHKVLYCERGSIVFHTPEGDFELRPGDRLDIPPGTDHSATVGAEGVRCLEASG